MRIIDYVYIAEVIIEILVISYFIYFLKIRKKQEIARWVIFSIFSFISIVTITYLLETPTMENVENITVEVNSEEKITIPKTIYHFKDVTENVNIVSSVDYTKIGEYSAYFKYKKSIGEYVKKCKIYVIDTKAPEIKLKGDKKYNLSYTKKYEEPGFEAIDEYDGDLTDKVVATKNEIDKTHFNVIYEVYDSSLNKTNVIREVYVIDDIAPVITLNGENRMQIYVNGNYEEKGASAKDEIDGDLTDKIKVEGEVDTSKEGEYTITYKVKDISENEAVLNRVVTVTNRVLATNSQTGVGTIYLTFDDGPTTNITPRILDILKEKNVKATFFVINYGLECEDIIKRENNEGHTVAIHGYLHDYKQIYKSEEIYLENITKMQERIRQTTGINSIITRFPGGSSNTVSRYNPGIMTRLCKLLPERGFRYFDWNVDSSDAGSARNSNDVYYNVVNNLSKDRANVVLMHDFSSNYKVLEALPKIIDFGIANGYTFSNITESTPMVVHRVNN